MSNNDPNTTLSAAAPGSTARPSLPDDMLIILPVRNIVPFPGVVLPVAMKREKTVLAWWRDTIETIVGKTLSIHGVSQRPPGAKMFCMSTQVCALP